MDFISKLSENYEFIIIYIGYRLNVSIHYQRNRKHVQCTMYNVHCTCDIF